MQDNAKPESSRFLENLCCAVSYITILPPAFMLLFPPAARNPRIRFHACQSILLNWILAVVAFFLHLSSGFQQLLGGGSGARFEWTARILCMTTWAVAFTCLSMGGRFHILFLKTLADRQANGRLFKLFAPPPLQTRLCSTPARSGEGQAVPF